MNLYYLVNEVWVIVLNKQKPMIFVLGHPSNTYTLHGLQSRKNGVEICNAKPLPIPIYIHNYFFFLTYYEEWDNPHSLLFKGGVQRPSFLRNPTYSHEPVGKQ